MVSKGMVSKSKYWNSEKNKGTLNYQITVPQVIRVPQDRDPKINKSTTGI